MPSLQIQIPKNWPMVILEFRCDTLTSIPYLVRIVFGLSKEILAIVKRGNRPLQRVSMILSFFLFWLELSLSLWIYISWNFILQSQLFVCFKADGMPVA